MACPSTQAYFHRGAYLHEVWAWFAIGSLVLCLRSAVRLRTVGWRRLQLDDYMAIAVWLCFLCDCVTITMVYKFGSNLDWARRDLAKLEPCQIKQIQIGSRMQLLAWYTYTALLWGLKAMMLVFLRRLTIGLFQERLAKIFAVITAACYIIVFLTISCGCLPIQHNWQVIPPPSTTRCLKKLPNFYVTTALNVGTDALILTIPLPLLWGMRLPLARKIALTLLLCSGIFVITAAIIRISFSMAGLHSLNINRWGTRETVAGIIAVNAPIIRPLFKRWFWQRGGNRTPSPVAFLPQNRDAPERRDRKSTIGLPRSRRKAGKSEAFGGPHGVHLRQGDLEITEKPVTTLHEDGTAWREERELEAGLQRPPEIGVETSFGTVGGMPTPDKPAPVLIWPPGGETHTSRTWRSSRSYGSRTKMSSNPTTSTLGDSRGSPGE
ncbi:hypothetical protein AC578_9605 [Lecanosticta acicola]|uniref:Rhodopsin domain-containing protein n=1 Tax=Lecanosticta acicola TaxID=111012 RepID=A0AAI8VUZ7_9PEZI|nr:hypothetical protein AC578_9605 [Lecanosticta acicola]